ncbi:SLAM family member 8-like [Engraulis encrasicolus]|uniref:SLAM family member 8-like n=1 Tax=Engraulis encrasicolus TaxID=184585 RepID=UPI002FD18631
MTLFIPLILVISAISSAQTVTKKKMGDFVVLEPGNKPDTLNSIVWKHGEDRAAEWYEGDPDVSYYRIFNGGSVLNRSTCSLTINNLDKRFNGAYTAEINGLNPTKSEKLEVLDPVSTVTISLDRDCDDDESDNCTLTCKGTGDGPLKYKWTPSLSSASVVMVPKGEKDTEYACEVSNPVSSQEGKYTMRVKGSQDPGPVAAAILVPLFL